MNAVEIEEAISALAEQPFDAAEFPFAFLQAFGNKETTLKRLRAGASNKSDLGGVLQTSNIHIATCRPGEVTKTLQALKASPATSKAKARFVLATDGDLFEAEDLTTDDPPVACTYKNFPDHFGFFLPLAGITTVKQIRENSFDIRATGRLNRLYIELLKDNPDWGTKERRHDMNHFMARLIFCFFAEDTDIFNGTGLFTATIEQMSERSSSNTHEVIGEVFRAMNTKIEDRAAANLPRWADGFPYVNGGLFSGSLDAPRFSRIARSYLIHIGNLDWQKINPDIFGSMMRTDFSYSNTLGWNTFPVPTLTDKNKADLTRCAQDILLAREAHFPATIADLYDPESMPGDLREAHERNDEVLERIYIGRRFRNDTERLEKLFELYTKKIAEKQKISA